VTAIPRKRGRPRRPFFKDGSPASLSGRPSGIPGWPTEFVRNQKAFEAKLRQDYNVGPHVPLALVWPLLARGEGHLAQEDLNAEEAYRVARETQRGTARLASEARASISTARMLSLRAKNFLLLKKIAAGTLTRNSAVAIVRNDWPGSGDGDPMPSARTLNDWLS
jgi:hypothetical protein